MFVEPGVVDTNVLVYACNADDPKHAAAQALIASACDPAVGLYVTSQIICEFYSVITNPRRVTLAASSTAALRVVSAILALPGITVLPTPALAVTFLVELLRSHPVTGGDVFDLQIVATMKANKILRIYTFDTVDFEVFPELTVVVPNV
jgi:predicted nucleic acid-binding protein